MAIVWDDERTPSAPTGIVWDDERTPSAPSTGIVWDHQPSTTPRSPGASFHDTLTTAWPIVSQVAEGFGIPRAIGNALFPPPPTPPVEYTRNASGRMIPVIPSQRVSAMDFAQEFPSALLSEAVSGLTPANLALGYVGGKAAQFLARTPLGQLRIPGLDRFTSPTILDPLTRPRGGFDEPPMQEAQLVEPPRQLTFQAPAETATPNLFEDVVPTPPRVEAPPAMPGIRLAPGSFPDLSQPMAAFPESSGVREVPTLVARLQDKMSEGLSLQKAMNVVEDELDPRGTGFMRAEIDRAAQVVEPRRALTFQEGSGMVAEGVPNVPSPPIHPVSSQSPLRRPALRNLIAERFKVSEPPGQYRATQPPIQKAKEPWQMTRKEFEPKIPTQIKIPAQIHPTGYVAEHYEQIGENDARNLRPIGAIGYFYRAGSLPASGFSKNYVTGRLEKGVSVYNVPDPTSFAGLKNADWYYGKGKIVDFGSDGEPIIRPIGKWKKFADADPNVASHGLVEKAHRSHVEDAIREGKLVPPEVLSEYPDLVKKYTSPLVRVRQQAITAVTRDLVEQSKILLQGSRDLKASVMRAGGIKPTVGGQLGEELHAIQPFLRTTGQPIDTLATELGFVDGEALRQALLAAQEAKLPTLKDLRATAEQIVASEPGNRILQAIQSRGAASQAVKRMIREVTSQTTRELRQAGRTVGRIVRRSAVTPAQLARIARTQRLSPGQTAQGPHGGVSEAALSPADLAQIQQRAKGIVPPRGQPTGTPPVIPTSTSLIPANVPRPVRDLNQFQSTVFSGLDSSRAAQLIDGTPTGPTTQMLTQLRKGELQAGQETQQILRQLIQVSHGMKAGSPESQQVFQILEGRLPMEGNVPTPRAAQTAEFMKRQFDAMLNEVNQARQSIGKRPIIRREGYITHLFDPKVWEDIKGAFTNAPDDATITLADKFREFLRANTPGFRFGLPRTGGPFEEDAIAAFKAYVPVAMRVKHLSSASRLASVYLDRSLAGTPNAHAYFSQLVRQVATGEKGPIAKLTPESMLRASNWLKSRFAKGMVLGNLSSVLQQVYTLPATVSATSPKSAAMAAAWISRGDGLSFAEQWSDIVKGRLLESDVDVRGIGSKIERVLGTPFAAADRAMVSHAFLSGYVEAVAQGADFQTAIQRGEHVALRTQSSFLTTDLSPVFRDSITSGFLQFQNTINSVFNFMKFDLDVLNTRPGESAIRNKWIAAGGLVGTFLALAAIFDALGLPRPNQLSEFVPGMSTLRTGGGPVAIRLMMSVSDLGSSDPQKRSQAIKALNTTAFAMGFGAGGNQLRKTLSGVSTVAQGGKLSKTGRLQFPVQGPAEAARAMTFGPYGTKTGQAYIQRGFKPEPLTPEQQLINRRLSAMRRSIRGR